MKHNLEYKSPGIPGLFNTNSIYERNYHMKITKEMLLQNNDPITTWDRLGLMNKIGGKPFTLIAHNIETDKRLPIGTFKSYTLNTDTRTLECTNTAEGDAVGVKVSTNTTHKFTLDNDDVDFIFIVDDKEIRLNDYKEKRESVTIVKDTLHVGDFVRLDILFGSFEYQGTALVEDVYKYGIHFLIHDLDDLTQYGLSIMELQDNRLYFDCELLHEAENPDAKKKG